MRKCFSYSAVLRFAAPRLYIHAASISISWSCLSPCLHCQLPTTDNVFLIISSMGDPLITFMGSVKIIIAVILSVKPCLIYDSRSTRALSSLTGLVSCCCCVSPTCSEEFLDQPLANSDLAPGFNQAIACMVAAVGVCHLVAARCGPAAKPQICVLVSLLICHIPLMSNILGTRQLLCM